MSGPQLGGPQSPMRGIEMDDRLGRRRDIDIVVRGGEILRPDVGDRDLARPVEVDPKPVAARSPSSSQRTSARPPFSWGQMYGTDWSVTVESQTPTRPPRFRSG